MNYIICDGVRVPEYCSLIELRAMLATRKIRFDNESNICKAFERYIEARTQTQKEIRELTERRDKLQNEVWELREHRRNLQDDTP